MLWGNSMANPSVWPVFCLHSLSLPASINSDHAHQLLVENREPDSILEQDGAVGERGEGVVEHEGGKLVELVVVMVADKEEKELIVSYTIGNEPSNIN